MKKIFRKAITVLSSVVLVGATIGGAIAASYPSPFTSNTAVVYGASAAPSDFTSASNIVSNLNSVATTSGVTLTGGSGVTEDEIPLGGDIISGKIPPSITDSKVSSLLDERISWDDGTGSANYDIDEQIVLTADSINLKTTFDDNDFAENVALTNDKAIEYRLVFGTAINVTLVGTDDADDLYLTILGKQYEITSMTASSITVVTSEKFSLSVGGSATVGGKTFTVDSIFSDSVEVNGEIISSSGTKKINGMRVEVDTIGYHSNAPELSRVVLKIGEDISKTYTDGEEYIGEDETDPEWVWTIGGTLGEAASYIGVKYNYKQTRDTDDVVYSGGSYVFPENFAEIKFDGLTDVDYEDFKIYFDDAEDLWNNTDLTSTAQTLDAPVLIIEAVDGREDAITLTNGSQETNKIYLRWANSTQETQGTQSVATLEVFYSDVDGTVQDAIKPRFSVAYASTNATHGNFSAQDLGDIIVGDTTIAMSAAVTLGNLVITFTDGGAAQAFSVDVGGDAILNGAGGTLKWFGNNTEATDKEAALAGDLLVASTNVGTYDNDIMTTNGQIIKTPEANLDNDEVIFSVPSDQVYGKVSVLAGGTPSGGEAGAIILKDTETSQMVGKNLVVVGGSAINAIAAELLGGAYRESAFTAATGVDAGEFLIQSFNRAGKTALLVAGYHAADTEKAQTYLLNQDVDTTVGKKYLGTSTTEATLVVV